MLRSLRVRISQGRQYIPDLRAASPANYRGLPTIAAGACAEGCRQCAEACPAQAFVALAPVTIDLGRCSQCGDCQSASNQCREFGYGGGWQCHRIGELCDGFSSIGHPSTELYESGAGVCRCSGWV